MAASARMGRKLAVGLLVVALVLVLGLAAVGFYYSTLLTTPDDPNSTPDQQVLATDGATVTLALDDYNQYPGLNSLLWDGGHAYLGEQLSITGEPGDGEVTYEVLEVTEGALSDGLEGFWSSWYYGYADPSDLGLDYEEVTPVSDVGELPSWYVPGDGDQWSIVVHGINSDREEGLRILPTLAEQGPVLVIRYRNDIGVPTSDNRLRLGDTEWQDVQAAMDWARDQGARQFVIVGFSYGGAVTLQTLDRAEGREDIVGAVLDSPVVSWQDTLEGQAALRGLPTVFGRLVGLVTEVRLGIDLADFDWVRRADEVQVPMLILHGLDDTFVPPGPGEELAAQRPDLVTFEGFDGAQHVRGWNVDRDRYENLVGDFVASVRTTQSAAAG